MITAPGPRLGLRVVAAVAITGGAGLLTYSGFIAYAYVAEQSPVFPLPPWAAPPATPPTSPTITPPPPNHEPGGVGIEITPAQPLRCADERCDQPVTIRSTGTAPLIIGEIELDGENAADFQRAGQCENLRLKPGQECVFEIQFMPTGRGETRHARLVIHQNLPGPPSFLALEGTPPEPPVVDLTASNQGAQCSYRRAGATGGGVLHVRFRLLRTGGDPDTATQPVRVTATSTSELAADYRSATGTPTEPAWSTATFTLNPTHFGRTHLIVVTVDPTNEIAEDNETNNQTRITINLPAATASTPGPCLARTE
jgi:hypothetical protein